jgi:NADPH:quinone reductase
MKAALCKSLDGPASLVVEELPEPAPGPGEAVVRVEAAALNFFDTLITRGRYQTKPELPFSPCGELAGHVENVGAGVTSVKPGDRVMAWVGYGAAREKVAVKEDMLVPVPDGVSFDVAAGLAITYGTALHGLVDRGALKAGETVAVLGAAGGAGLAAVEVAKLMGARVIAVAGGTDKLALTRAHGADETFDYSAGNLRDGLKALTGGRGVDVVYDCVGGADTEAALRSLAWEGRLLVVGFASGAIPSIPLNLTLVKGCAIVGVFWGESVRRGPARHIANMQRLLGWVSEGRLDPVVHGTYPLDRIVEALAVIENRQAKGKVIIRP